MRFCGIDFVILNGLLVPKSEAERMIEEEVRATDWDRFKGAIYEYIEDEQPVRLDGPLSDSTTDDFIG